LTAADVSELESTVIEAGIIPLDVLLSTDY